jgi:hypothetical protein
MSKISYHTHNLQIRGHPLDLPLQPQTVQRGRGVGGGGALPCSFSTDKPGRRQVKWCAGWGERGEGEGCSQQITAHNSSYSFFSLSFYPLCIRWGFDEKFAHAVQNKNCSAYAQPAMKLVPHMLSLF